MFTAIRSVNILILKKIYFFQEVFLQMFHTFLGLLHFNCPVELNQDKDRKAPIPQVLQKAMIPSILKFIDSSTLPHRHGQNYFQEALQAFINLQTRFFLTYFFILAVTNTCTWLFFNNIWCICRYICQLNLSTFNRQPIFAQFWSDDKNP